MAGHSEWHNRKYRKRRVDRKRAKLFDRLSRKIIRAARQGGGDPEVNLELKWAIEEARDADMPSENIERAIKRGTGELNRENGEAVRYEGFAPGNVAVLIEAYTDNRSRTHADLRQIFNENDGSLAEEGSVSPLFDEQCVFIVQDGNVSEDELLDLVISNGGEDIESKQDGYTIYAPAVQFDTLRSELNEHELDIQNKKIIPVPKTEVAVSESEAEKLGNLVSDLERNLDVQSVHTNLSSELDLPASESG